MTAKAPTVAIEKINAEQAKQYLASASADQRAIKPSHVLKLTRELLADGWEISPDAIAFDENGKLWNGQHRMKALVDAAKINPAVEASFIVMRDAYNADAAMDITDQGVKRSLADTIFRRFANGRSSSWASNVSAASKKAYLFEKTCWGSKATVPDTAYLEWYENNRGIADSISVGENVYSATKLNASMIAAFHYLFSRDCDPDTANAFFDALKTEDYNNPKSATNALRRRMRNLKTMQHVAIAIPLQAVLVVKAWNLWLQGTDVGMLRAQPDESVQSWTQTYKALND